jgi:hypothetical protein
MNPRPPRSRKIIVTLALLGAALLATALATADWRLLRTEYHAFRLNRAQTREAAEPHLEALLGLAAHEPAAKALVAKLGAERQLLTYWVLRQVTALVDLDIDGPDTPEARYVVRFLPWLRGMVARCERDDPFTAAGAHFVRWNGRGFLADQEAAATSTANNAVGFVAAVLLAPLFSNLAKSIGEEIEEKARRHPEWFETLLRGQHLLLREQLWTSGAPATRDFTAWTGPGLTSEQLFAYAEALEEAQKDALRWWSAERAALDFDPASGRFVKRDGGDHVKRSSPPAVPRPQLPLPRWQGPVPEDSLEGVLIDLNW